MSAPHSSRPLLRRPVLLQQWQQERSVSVSRGYGRRGRPGLLFEYRRRLERLGSLAGHCHSDGWSTPGAANRIRRLRIAPGMDTVVDRRHLSEPGLVVLDIVAVDEPTVTALAAYESPRTTNAPPPPL